MDYQSLSCPFDDCSFNAKQERRFANHLTDIHGVDDHEALYAEKVLSSSKKTCACNVDCKEPVKWDGWKRGYISRFARGHNARIDSVYFDPMRQSEFVAKRVEGYATGRCKVWNEGLTKETDKRIARSAEKTSSTLVHGYGDGRIVPWQLGLTKDTDTRLKKSSETKRAKFDSGVTVTWSKGKTKHDTASLVALSESIAHVRAVNKWGQLSTDQLIERISTTAPGFELITLPSAYKNKYQRLEVRCKDCGRVSEKTISMLAATPVCFSCHPKESKGQLELFEFVRSIANDAKLSDRTVIAPKELDVWVPSRMFGVEYDGLYWHSELFVDEAHQSRKLSAVARANVKILRIFEDEWREKRRIVEGMIAHRLGVVSRKIGARECELVELTSNDRHEFFESNHIDGDAKARSAWGLVHDDNIVAALSIRRPFHAKHSERMEVSRFACAVGTVVPGALSRLAQHARSSCGVGLLTYVDCRIGLGHAYERAGFKRLGETRPRFWWTDFKKRIDRFKIRADASSGITQEQAAEAAGVVRIFGSPNVTFTYD